MLEHEKARRDELAELRAAIAELKLSRTQKTIRLMRTKRRLVVAMLVCFVGIPLLHAAVPHTFTAGTPAVAADMNANLTYLDEISVPVGGIIGWHKSFAGVPALPASGKWVECNGQLLADAGSALDGQTIPNLNGAAGGADSPGQDPGVKARLFLRGGTTSGPGEKDAFQGHWHSARTPGSAGVLGPSYAMTGILNDLGAATGWFNPIQNPIADATNGDPRTANETRPSNMAACGELGEPWCGL